MSLPGEQPNTTHLSTLLNRAISLTKGLFKSETSGSRCLPRAPCTPKPKHLSDGDKPLPLHRVSLCRRLGLYSTFILLAGSLVLVSAVGFLAFLWWSDRANELWRWIVLDDKSSTATVITAVFIQLTVSAQAAVAVSMLASLTLESCGVLLRQSLPLSLARYSNTGPVASLAMFSRNLRKLKGIGAFASAIGLAITTASSQFASTLLISDVSMGTIEDYPTFLNISTRPTIITSPSIFDTTDYTKLTPAESQTFAEDSDPVDTPEDQVDTGKVYRAFLPFSDKASRQNVLEYSGTATVYDARVVCVRPKLSNFTMFYDRAGYMTFGGKISPSSHIPGASWPTNGNSSDSWVDVSCRTDWDLGWGYGYSYVFCRLPDSVHMNTDIPLKRWPYRQGHGWFLFSWSGIPQTADLNYDGKNEAGWVTSSGVYLPAYSSPSTSSWNSTEAGPWLSISPTRITSWLALSPTGITINATICYDSFARSANIDIFATSSSNRTEPSSRFMTPKNMSTLGSHSTESGYSAYDFDDVKKQAGATLSRYSHAERGILSLDRQRLRQSLRQWKDNDAYADPGATNDTILLWPPMDGIATHITQIYWAAPSGRTVTRTSGDFTTINYKHAALFLSTVEETRDPSLAIQALFLSFARTPYYLFLPDYDYGELALTKNAVVRSYPRTNRGISAVLSIIGVHLALVLVITVLFCLRTKYSLLDQAWPAVAQVFTNNTEAILRVSTLSKDTDVEKMVGKSGGKFDGCVHLREERGSGRVGIVF